jgi:ATP-dependent Lhr-like helicase
VQGRWSLVAPLFGDLACAGGASATAPSATAAAERRRTLAELLLERYGIVTREQVLAEGIAGGFSMLYDALANLETLGVCRRGYFIEGLGGAQFALPAAVERLRAQRADEHRPAQVLAAADPAQPYGAVLAWPSRPEGERRPARVSGAHVVVVESAPALYVERGGRGLLTLGADRERLRVALAALAGAVQSGRVGKLAVEKVDGEAVVGSDLEPLLIEHGFRSGPRKLTLSA